MNWIEERLVPEAREWWRLWSIRLIGVALAIDALTLAPIVAMLPANVRGINPLLFDVIQMVLLSAAVIVRFVRQKKVEKNVQARKQA